MFCKYRYIILLTLASMTVLANSRRLSGLYVDNGLDQTIAHQTINFKDKKDIEYKLLNILGLRDRPKRITRRDYLVKRSAPKFLLNIYSNVLFNEKDVWSKIMDNQEFDLTGQDINAIDQSDVIMTFGALNSHSAFGAKKNRGRRIWFDVSEAPDIEHIIAAELRLYQSTNFEKLQRSVSYTIAVYRVARTENGKRLKHYIDSRNITIGQEGWITLNVSRALQYWIDHPNENRGLFLTIRGYDSHTLRPDDIGIIGVLGIPDKQPFMVGFFRSSETRNAIARIKRNAQQRNNELMTKSLRNNPFIDRAVRRSTKVCSIQTLYVNFRDLQWQDWIIAPEGYDAYYCSGECNFPLNSHMNATNHAIVQTLVHLIKPGKVPKPCCSPTKLSSISVLYFLDDSNVVLKKYKNMVVSSCGCH